MITQTELKHALDYNPGTGQFTWKNPTSTRVKVGQIAGTFHAHRYARIRINSIQYLTHRLVWLYVHGESPASGLDIDHINNDRLDNRIANLRLATRQENLRNARMHKGHTNGYKGITYWAAKNLWKAQSQFNGKHVNIGCFKNREDAADAYITFAKLHFGEFYNPGNLA